jgi:hypothetical protein
MRKSSACANAYRPSVEVMEYDEAYSNLGLSNLQYNIWRLSREEKDNVIV